LRHETKVKKSQLVSLNLIEADVSISNLEHAQNPYTFLFKAADLRRDEDPNLLIIKHYDADYTGLMRLFNAKIINDSHYIPINILYILYKIGRTVNADSIRFTFNADSKVDERNYDLLSDYYDSEINIIISNDSVYKHKKDNLYEPYRYRMNVNYDYIMKQVNRLRLVNKILIDCDLSNIGNDTTIKGYIYNNIFEQISYGIQYLLIAYRQYIISQ
jgi:hypothetical protein